jgi:putative ABC transport system permease protein
VNHVSSNYFSLLRIPLVRGQVFSSDAADVTDVVVNEAFARTLRGQEVLGAVVRAPSGPFRIVGVVGDVQDTWLTTRSTPLLYAPIARAPSGTVAVTARSRRLPQAAAEMRKAIERIHPEAPPVAVEPLGQIVWRSEVKRRFYLRIAGTFAIVALLVSALGIFSAVGRVVAFRTRDIAIRIALGARRAEVARLVLLEGMRPGLLGVGAGLAGGFALVRIFESHPFVQSLLFKVGSTDLSTYALPVSVALGSAVVACLVPLRRALRLDPAATFRAE